MLEGLRSLPCPKPEGRWEACSRDAESTVGPSSAGSSPFATCVTLSASCRELELHPCFGAAHLSPLREAGAPQRLGRSSLCPPPGPGQGLAAEGSQPEGCSAAAGCAAVGGEMAAS